MESSVKILEDYGLDGLDVDYEYPQNDEQATGYVHLLREMREALDRHAERKGRGCGFLLTVRLCVLPAARAIDIAIRRLIRLPPLVGPTTTISFMWRK